MKPAAERNFSMSHTIRLLVAGASAMIVFSTVAERLQAQ
jgi:hypothetical protein